MGRRSWIWIYLRRKLPSPLHQRIDVLQLCTYSKRDSLKKVIPQGWRWLQEYANISLDIEIDQTLFPPLLRLIFGTYPYYHDRESRRAVSRCIQTIFGLGASPKALVEFVKLVHVETSKPGIAPSNAFVLVEWCSILLQEISGTEHWERWGLETIQSNAQALELCVGEYSRANVKNSALVVTRRGLRKAFSDDATRKIAIEGAIESLASKKAQPSARNAVMLGVIAGVCARKNEAKKVLEQNKSSFFAFFNREIIGSRTPVPAHIANGMEDFFEAFTSKDDLEKEIIPSLEKALLRAPEIVLNDLVTPLFNALPDSIDLSQILQGSLLRPLLANVKSSNAVIRQGSLSAFRAAIKNSKDAKVITKIAEDIVGPLKAGKLSSPEQRAIHADMILALPLSQETATKVATDIAAIAAKEPNELALTSETLALVRFVSWSVFNGVGADKSIIDAFTKGISDKKVVTKKLWSIRLGELFWHVNDEDLLKSKLSPLAEAVIAPFLDIWQETLANPLSAAQTGLVSAAYAFTALSSKLTLTTSPKVVAGLKKAQIQQQATMMEPKPSFLLNPRIYGKLSNDTDFTWFIRALSSVSKDVCKHDFDSSVALGWSQAIIFCIASSAVKTEARKLAMDSLSKLYVNAPEKISNIIVAGLWQWRDSLEAGEKDSAAASAKSDSQNLHFIIKSICLSPAESAACGKPVEESVRRNQLVSLLILSRPELLPRVRWIDLCLRMEVDPGDLAQRSQDALLEEVTQRTNFTEKVSFTTSISY